VPQESLPVLAGDAARQWTGTFNPRPVDQRELLRLYETAY
jgi:alcohol dehydrogenase